MSRLLVIDDDELVRISLMKILKNAGYETVTATNGIEGLSVLKEGNIDAIITDLIMPEKDGIETIQEVKVISPDMPIIAISGGGRTLNPEIYLSLAKEFGAVTVLAKPFSIKALLEAVEESLKI